MNPRIPFLGLAAVAMLSLNSCIIIAKETSGQSVGRKLVDLQAARNAGALTETEYRQQKAAVLAEKKN